MFFRATPLTSTACSLVGVYSQWRLHLPSPRSGTRVPYYIYISLGDKCTRKPAPPEPWLTIMPSPNQKLKKNVSDKPLRIIEKKKHHSTGTLTYRIKSVSLPPVDLTPKTLDAARQCKKAKETHSGPPTRTLSCLRLSSRHPTPTAYWYYCTRGRNHDTAKHFQSQRPPPPPGYYLLFLFQFMLSALHCELSTK